MTGTVEVDMILALVAGNLIGIAFSALIWLVWGRRPDPMDVDSITQPAVDDRLYEWRIETNGEADLAKLAAKEGVAFDGAGDPGEPEPYKAKDIPF